MNAAGGAGAMPVACRLAGLSALLVDYRGERSHGLWRGPEKVVSPHPLNNQKSTISCSAI
jgi:hypothetical protein